MNRQAIRLHEAAPGNGLAADPMQQQGRLRLNFFAGRSLGEREFDIMQRYAEQRLAPLFYGHPAGIIEGFEVAAGEVPLKDGAGSDWLFRVRPGLAVAGDGKIINMVFPLDQYWREQKAEFRPNAPIHGIYFLLAQQALEPVDKNGNYAACVRDELDLLRDSRIETATRLSLLAIAESDEAVAAAKADQDLAINRLLAEHVQTDWLAGISGVVPIAMLAVENDTVLWVDAVAGRIPAKIDANYWRFLAHTSQAIQNHFDGWFLADDAGKQALIDSFKLAYLPAAGVLPTLFLDDVATLPKPHWFPAHLQVEMAPVAESRVQAVIERELPRSAVDLEVVEGDRIRLLLAVPDADYRADLLDLPFPDRQMEQDLYRYGQRAHDSWKAWVIQYDALFDNLQPSDYATAEGKRLFGSIPERIDTEAEGQPLTPEAFFIRLITASRDWQTAASDIDPELPAPYTDTIPLAPAGEIFDFSPPPASDADGLLKQYLDLAANIEHSEALIDELADLLTLYADMQRSQRQQIDHVSLSFSRLAGGVPGDGSGLAVARWLPDIKFTTKGTAAP
jgi:hypothetical protein